MKSVMKRVFPDAFQSGSAAEKKSIIISSIISVVMLAVDQLTKIAVMHSFKLGESRSVIEGVFSWTYVRNRGAAWGILAGRTWLLLLTAVVVAALTVKFFRKLTEGYSERIFALLLVLSGIVGNSIDRIWHGEVIDFIDFHYYDMWSYPVFNVADIAICTGVGVYMLSNLLRKTPKEEQK